MTEIFTTGYPKSGNTWIGRLLSDLLDSPMQIPTPEAVIEKQFCQTADGGYIIRKTHWLRQEWDGKSKMVFIQRDPRDVAISAMFYRSLEPTTDNLMGVIKTMTVREGLAKKYQIYHRQGWYAWWLKGWLDCDNPNLVRTRYEWLHKKPITELARITFSLTGKQLPPSYIEECNSRQTFTRWQREYPHSMRRGVIGDWKNYFRVRHGEFMNEYLGELMLEQGYIRDYNWWKGLPE